MKTLVIIIIAGTMSAAYGQRYKIKDDVILLSKEPVGKIVEVQGSRTDLTIFGINGEKVLHVSNGAFVLNNPFLRDNYWYLVKFEDTGKEMKIGMWTNCEAKCILNRVFDSNGIKLDGTVIKDQDAIITKFDLSQQINKDTIASRARHNEWMSLLKTKIVLRNKQTPIVLMRASQELKENEKTTTYRVTQDNVVVGKLIKNWSQTPGQSSASYSFYRQFTDPDGSVKDVPVATVPNGTTMLEDFEILTVIDGARYKMTSADGSNAEKIISAYLIEKGYL